MADDPYDTLGISRGATDQEIRRAYLKLAKSSHPDLNPNDPAAEARFKAINAAHALLSDPTTRARFDRGEIDAAGHERPPPEPPPGQRRYREHAEGPAGARYRAAEGEGDLGDIFSELFRAQARAARDRHYTLTVPFLDAIRGTTQRLALPDGGDLDVRIPPGLESGQILRLRGKGAPGDPHGDALPGDALPGDALIEVTVAPHPLFQRHGSDIHYELPVTLAEAVLGARIDVPTIDGRVTLAIPPGSDSGTKLRLRGKGVPAASGHKAGDAYVTLRVVLDPADRDLADFLRNRKNPPAWNPRAGMESMA